MTHRGHPVTTSRVTSPIWIEWPTHASSGHCSVESGTSMTMFGRKRRTSICESGAIAGQVLERLAGDDQDRERVEVGAEG